MEVIKFVTCIGVIAYQKGGIAGLTTSIREEVLAHPWEIVLLSVPSLVYSAQNNLLYFALSHLDAATYQVGYQAKILTTAIFSVFMLNKRISLMQWFSLVILTVGVGLAQLSAAKNDGTKANTTAGFIAVLIAACMSGFAGVYFEKMLKSSGTSLWIRNIQMGVSSIIGGVAGIYLSGELDGVRQNGFFYGYNNIVVMVILLQAVGGLVVAVVVKYADNILKGFAASFSIVTSCILSYVAFDFHPTWVFALGAVLVNVSMYLYTFEPPAKDKTVGEKEAAPRRNVVNMSALERGGGGGGAHGQLLGLGSRPQDADVADSDHGGNSDHEK
jgi:UDP-sugar transporter A1/2/3